MTVRPGMTVRDSQILDLLLAGVPKSFITERGIYRRSWNAADVERVAARQLLSSAPSSSPARQWTPPVPATAVSVTIPSRVAEVLDGVCEGLTNREIAARLHLSEDTIKTYASRLLAALGANDRGHAAAIACAGGADIRVESPTGRTRSPQAVNMCMEGAA